MFFVNLEKKSGLAGCVTFLEVHYTILALFRASNYFDEPSESICITNRRPVCCIMSLFVL
jgi:hypothetical protein